MTMWLVCWCVVVLRMEGRRSKVKAEVEDGRVDDSLRLVK